MSLTNTFEELKCRIKRLKHETKDWELSDEFFQEHEDKVLETIEELKIKNFILSAQQEASLDGILVVGQEGEIVSFNQRFVEMWEIPSHVIGSKSDDKALDSVLNKLVDPESFIKRVKYLYEHREEKSREDIALIDGRVFDRYSAPIFGEGKEYYGRIWFFRDITKSKHAEEAQQEAYAAVEMKVTERTAKLLQANKNLQLEILERKQVVMALRESEEKFKMLFEKAPDAYYLNDMEGVFIDGNRTAEELLGYKREDLIGKNFMTIGILPEDQMLKAAEILEKGFKGRAAPAEEFELIRKDGRRVSVEIGSIPIKLEGRNVFLGIARDITERKRLEENLRQAQKMESIGTLAGGIAHDFNNILYPIIGFTEMTMDDVPENSLARDNLKEILQATKRAKELVQQILTFSRQKDKDYKPLRIQVIVEEALKLLRASIPTSIEIRQNIENSCGAVMGDSSEIHQVIMNLCTNAYHAMQDKGGVLEIGLAEVEVGSEERLDKSDMKAGRYAQLVVSDTGHGISSDILPRIYEPYFTTKEQGKGTGMGLSVTHGIIKNHGGEIKVDSEHRKGTTVNVYLPLIDNTADNIESASAVKTPKGKEHILLVDDEEQIVRMVKQMLDRLGYNVTARVSSVDALEAFKHHSEKFDLVITDMTMPNMMGDTFAKKVMTIRPDVPIILCTGFSERMSDETAESMGISAMIRKPIVKNEMAQIIRSVLDS